MKTFANAAVVPIVNSIYVHGESNRAHALSILTALTKDSFEKNPTFNIETNKPALLYSTSSYAQEVDLFKNDSIVKELHVDFEMVSINGMNYIAVTLKEKEEKKETIKELNDSGFNVRAFLHIGYAANLAYAQTINSSKNNLINRLPGLYQPLNHPSFLEGKDFWLLNNYSVSPEALQRFIDNIKDQVPFNLEVVKINSRYYIAMTEKEEVKQEKKEEIFIGNTVNAKARLTLEELNTIDFYGRHLGLTSYGLSWTTLNFGSATVADRQAFIDYHNGLGGQYEFVLHNSLVNYRKRPEEVNADIKEEPKAEPKTETVVEPTTPIGETYLVITEDGDQEECSTLAKAIEAAKEYAENGLVSNDPVDIYKHIGTVKLETVVNVEELKTNPLADAANHPTEQPKTNGEITDQQYAGGF